MSAITPDSYVKLVRFDVTKEHQITFADLQAQLAYFQNLNGLELQASTYQRKEGKVRFPAVIDELEQYNYLIYRNESDTTPNYYGDKTYFCYITDMEYINDNMTEITIVQDVFQTWQFDFVYKKCFVEREHVNDDTIGKNVIPEGLETGEYIPNYFEDFTKFNKICWIAQVTKEYTSPYSNITATKISGQFFTGAFYILLSYIDVVTLVHEYTTNVNLGFDAILNIYPVPYCLNDYYNTEPLPPSTTGAIRIVDYDTINTFSFEMNKPTSIDGYTPVNKKLLTKEYNYLTLSNNNGVTEVFDFNLFSGTKASFIITGLPTIGCSVIASPSGYGNGSGMYNDTFKISGGKFPQTDYIKDNYQIWLRQNSLNLQLGVIGGLVQTAVGGAEVYGGDIMGISNIMGGIGSIFGVMKQKYLHNLVPPTSTGNVNISDVNMALQKNTFTMTQMCISSKYAKIIDDFFSMYGYKVTEIKVPNITGRTNWNYVKTINAIVESSSVPDRYLNEFKEMLNNGITFWHNPSTFLDYSQTNSIVI